MTNEPTTEPEVNLSKLGKIRAMLDKAESTAAEFPAEAEALTAKAIDMMETYRITEAMIADAAPLQDRGQIIETEILVGSGPYVMARVDLASNIGRAHSVKVLTASRYEGRVVYLIGYETDVALTEMLYTSLLVQATSALTNPEVKASKPGHVHGKAFARSFLMGFASRIGTRLRESSAQATEAFDAAPAEGARSVALVLADRMEDVEEDVLRRYGKLRSVTARSGSSSWEGTLAGQAAADKADLGTSRGVSATTMKRKALR